MDSQSVGIHMWGQNRTTGQHFLCAVKVDWVAVGHTAIISFSPTCGRLGGHSSAWCVAMQFFSAAAFNCGPKNKGNERISHAK